MDQILRDFLRALRGAGVQVSIPESIDAMNTVKLVGYQDREVLKDALSVVLAKSGLEKESFDMCFDRFFSFGSFAEGMGNSVTTPILETPTDKPSLADMLLVGDIVGLAASLREAAQEVGIIEMQSMTQKGLFTGRLLRHMGIGGLHRDIQLLRQQNTSSDQQKADRLEEAEALLLEQVGDFVDQQFALFAGPQQEEIIERYLRKINLSNLEEKDLRNMHVVVQKMVKRLNDTHSRRRKAFRRGQLDFRHTLRSNITYDGLLFDVKWKKRKIDRPDIVALCDVSNSVSAVVRFLLLFLHSLNRRLARIRTFTFCSNIVEVSHIFDENPVEEALVKLQSGSGSGIVLGPTDYGQALRSFEENWSKLITHRTTVLILGDARNNFGDPETKILESIYHRCKRLIWLNPESRSAWGNGDSEMKRYLPHCHIAKECNTVAHLEQVVDSLLHVQ